MSTTTRWRASTRHTLDEALAEDVTTDMVHELPGYGIVTVLEGRLILEMTIEAGDFPAALAEALAVGERVSGLPVSGVSVMTEDEHLDEITGRVPPEVVSIADIASMGHGGEPKTRQWAQQLVAREDFPRPVNPDSLRQRQWLKSAVSVYLENYRPKTGRPPKK